MRRGNALLERATEIWDTHWHVHATTPPPPTEARNKKPLRSPTGHQFANDQHDTQTVRGNLLRSHLVEPLAHAPTRLHSLTLFMSKIQTIRHERKSQSFHERTEPIRKIEPVIAKEVQNTGNNVTRLLMRAENLHLEQLWGRFSTMWCVLVSLTRYLSALPPAEYV